MKKFLKRICLFLLPLAVVYGTLELKLESMPNTYSQKRTDFEDQLNDIQVLVLGQSHSFHGINPQYFSLKGFNLANASQTVYYDKALTLHYLDQMPKLKLVIIPIDYNSLYTQLYDSKESFRCFFYSKYWNIQSPGVKYFDSRRFSNLMRYTPEKTWDFITAGFKVNLAEGLASNGYLRYDTVDNDENISELQGIKRVELYRRMMKEEHYDEIAGMLNDLISTLRQRNINVAIVTTPVYQTFAHNCEPQVLENNIATIRTLCSTYNCRYIDYFTDPRFTKRDFYDNDHLNFIGAEKFSRILDHDFIQIISYFGKGGVQ
jgi:hypothetical protein